MSISVFCLCMEELNELETKKFY
uniref:Uncharacterized protein n=1 Tax=Musa acuminata subsp. malaccensis TaxID=214687 RepID=A0A804I8S2_MUSAM